MDVNSATCQSSARYTPAQHAGPPRAQPTRRRTLGLCAHCQQPVDVTDEYIRLYRRAWHLECALASEPTQAPDGSRSS